MSFLLREKGETLNLAGSNTPNVLFLTEGNDETGLVISILEQKNVDSEKVKILDIRGVDNLHRTVKLLKIEPNFSLIEKIGIIVDADENPIGRLSEINKSLREVSFPIRNQKDDLRFKDVISSGRRNSGIFVSPGNGDKGNIDTIIKQEITTTKSYSCLNTFNTCISNIEHPPLSDKAFVRCYLNSRNYFLTPGHAFKKRILDSSCIAYDDIRDLVFQLLPDSSA